MNFLIKGTPEQIREQINQMLQEEEHKDDLERDKIGPTGDGKNPQQTDSKGV